jgi:NAD(P)-dependent dehydrogenase (short-subunit alcohol dehydrogenase family)
MDLQLQGRRALVTGGTRGIGRAIVEALAGEGVRVAFCARGAEAVAATEKELRDRGLEVSGTTVDVADADALRAWVAASAGDLGGLDIVVANVSSLELATDEDGWHRAIEIDLMHTVRTVEASIEHLKASDAGCIIAISTVSAREIDVAAYPYGSIKAALLHYVSGLATQLAPHGVRANVVSPGNTFFDGGIWDQIRQGMPDLYEQTLALNPTGRMGTPEEVAYAVTMLASPRASRISGTNLLVDGALTRGVQV